MRSRISRVFLLVVLVMSVLTISARALADIPAVSFTGNDSAGRTFTGTFVLDHFTVKTPLNLPQLVNPPTPQLVAVGSVSGVLTSFSPPGGLTSMPFAQAPFVWVKLTIAADCGQSVLVTFGDIGGSDYVSLHGQDLWDPSVPLPVWNPDVHWGSTVTNPLVEIARNGGLACAINRAIGRNDLSIEARLLNILLARQ